MQSDKTSARAGHGADDQQILAAIRDHRGAGSRLLTTFFQGARNYALCYLRNQYPDLDESAWETIFTNVDVKLVTRVRKGLELKEGTRLTTYYTSVAKFAALDFVRDRQRAQSHEEVLPNQAIEPPAIEGKMEQEERSQRIRQWLEEVISNQDQVEVLLYHTQGYTYKEIVGLTNYRSEGACRNAWVKGKKKITEYLMEHPEAVRVFRKLLQED